jgi:hypothetical protein
VWKSSGEQCGGPYAADGASGKSNTVVSQGWGQEIGGEQRKDKKTYAKAETSYCHWGAVWGALEPLRV